MSYAFSPSNNAFYPLSLKTAYEVAGTWPEDYVLVDDDIFKEFSGVPPEGKIRSVNGSGIPEWVDAPQIEMTEWQRKARARTLRDDFIACTDKLLITDYTINNIALSDDQRNELLKIRSSFKVWPDSDNWPEVALPDIPQWLLIEAVNNGYVVYNWPEEKSP